MADRKILEVIWEPPRITHRATVLMECGHHDLIEESGNRLKLPEKKWCLSCDANGDPGVSVDDAVYDARRQFFDWRGENNAMRPEVVMTREARQRELKQGELE